MRILLIEDDAPASHFICEGLTARGHIVVACEDGRDGLRAAAAGGFDVLVVDRMLPGVDGLSLVRALRTAGTATPAILLTALGGVADRIDGLRAGADDYLVKPFDIDELDARMEAMGRRPPMATTLVILKSGDLELHRLARRVTFDGRILELTGCEFAMLEMLMLNAGRGVTKAMLLEAVFDLQAASTAAGSIIEPHVSRLRGKLCEAGAVDVIMTLRGRGYSIAAD